MPLYCTKLDDKCCSTCYAYVINSSLWAQRACQLVSVKANELHVSFPNEHPSSLHDICTSCYLFGSTKDDIWTGETVTQRNRRMDVTHNPMTHVTTYPSSSSGHFETLYIYIYTLKMSEISFHNTKHFNVVYVIFLHFHERVPRDYCIGRNM